MRVHGTGIKIHVHTVVPVPGTGTTFIGGFTTSHCDPLVTARLKKEVAANCKCMIALEVVSTHSYEYRTFYGSLADTSTWSEAHLQDICRHTLPTPFN